MNAARQKMIHDILTGLLVSAAFGAVMPNMAEAQNLAAAGIAAKTSILQPMVQFVSYIAYGTGSVMTVAGIAGCKKHSDNPTANPLAPALGRLGAGACFLSVPAVAGMLSGTVADIGMTNTVPLTRIGGF